MRQNPKEAEKLHQAIATDHDGSIFDNLMGLFGKSTERKRRWHPWSRLRKPAAGH
jgi:hypothetical protein